MRTALTAGWTRVFGLLGRVSMYRLVMLSLAALAAISLTGSLLGAIGPQPLEVVATAVVLAIACAVTDLAAQTILRRPRRLESSAITAGILLFVVFPTVDPVGLMGVAIAGFAASVSKYVLVWRGRHVFNPAAVGAAVLTIVGAVFPALGFAGWWVGTPVLAVPVILLGLAVLWRTERVRVVAVFLIVAIGVSVLRVVTTFGSDDLWGTVVQASLSSPFLFLGAFMLSEPLTMPPRRWQQYAVAGIVGVFAGWPISVGAFTLGQEFALLIGNFVAFLLCLRAAVSLTLVGRREPTPVVRELTFRAKRPFPFQAGQYLELDLPHRRPDARGTRREFSIVSAPEDLPVVRIAYKDGSTSSYKRALAEVPAGTSLAVTGVWGDFVLPQRTADPVLLVAAGIGITPFVSQLRHVVGAGERRDIVLVYVASDAAELAFRDDIESAGIPVVLFTRDAPADLPANWTWAGAGVRLDADALVRLVPDLAARHAYISGPPRLIADLAPALSRARSLTTDAFAGY